MNRPLLVLTLLLLGAIHDAQAGPAAASAEDLIAASRSAIRNAPESSRALAEQALAELDRHPDADLQVDAHWLLCDYYAERDRHAARQQLEAGRALLPRTTRPALAAELLSCEGDLSELAGDSARALTLYEQSIAVAGAAHDDAVMANALYQRGYLRGVRGELSNGLTDLRHANEIFEHLHSPQEALDTLVAVATLYDRMGDHAQARRYFEAALSAQRRAGLVREQAVTQHNLGRALESLGDWPASQAAFEAALALSREIAYPRGQAYALRGLASLSNDESLGIAALAYAERAAALLDQAPDARLRAQIALQRGIALRLLGKPAESLAALLEAQKVLEAADSEAELTVVHGELAATFAALGAYKPAYEQANEFKAASDRLLKRQIEERFATLKVELDTAVTERENQLLKREKLISDHALAQEQRAGSLRAIALALAAILVGLLSVLVLRHRRTSRRMHGLAMTDELTRLWNRRHSLNTLQAMIAAGKPCAVLIADLDLFKAVNDRHGHLIGDEILRAAAAGLLAVVPAGAELGRLGGEEFIVLLPGATHESALRVAERARRSIAELDASPWLPEAGITISVGVTMCGTGDELSAALRRADKALYEAKRSGRNCVRSSPTEETMPSGQSATATP
jgi:diguanylate cyclase (GGDEF)-like protein